MSLPPPHQASVPNGPVGSGPYPYPQPAPTNSLAIASLVCAFLFAPLGIIFGHISLSQIKRSGEEGRGLAIAGLVISYVVTVATIVVVIIAAIFVSWLGGSMGNMYGPGGPNNHYRTSTSMPDSGLPPFVPPANLGANCTYPATTTPASKPATPPRAGQVPTKPATVTATMTTNAGAIGLKLDNAKAPCTVNSFVNLAQQGYFDGTPCHRLTTSPESGLLQCGDPTGTGSGGPGYRFANEYPTNQYRPFDPALKQSVRYPRGTLAMANDGPGANGSQFFIVYRDSLMPPTYTAFGTVDETGLAIVDRIAASGVDRKTGSADDGPPAQPVTLESIRLD